MCVNTKNHTFFRNHTNSTLKFTTLYHEIALFESELSEESLYCGTEEQFIFKPKMRFNLKKVCLFIICSKLAVAAVWAYQIGWASQRNEGPAKLENYFGTKLGTIKRGFGHRMTPFIRAYRALLFLFFLKESNEYIFSFFKWKILYVFSFIASNIKKFQN